MRGSVSFASLFIIFMGTAYASKDSLPGEPLYAMKVQVAEEMVALTKTTPQERIAYDITRMQTRLAEIQTVLQLDTALSSEDLAVFTHQIEEHTADITAEIETTDESVMPHEQKIDTLKQLSGLGRAQVKVARSSDELSEISETLEETHESASMALTATVDDFIDEQSAEVVQEYISDQITEIAEDVQASTTDEIIRDATERHLYDVDEALTDGDTSGALLSILEAQEVIDVDMYLDGSDETLESETTDE